MAIYIPPNGFAGFAQQTTAVQSMGQRRGARSTGRRRKKKAAGATKRRVRRASGARKTRSGGKFTKGSAAAKRHMAKLRKMRRK